jgi:hypothetical protein
VYKIHGMVTELSKFTLLFSTAEWVHCVLPDGFQVIVSILRNVFYHVLCQLSYCIAMNFLLVYDVLNKSPQEEVQ